MYIRGLLVLALCAVYVLADCQITKCHQDHASDCECYAGISDEAKCVCP
eukprot:gene191-11617_t